MFIHDEYFENIFNAVREGILILDEDMRVLSANRSFFTTFRVDSANTVGSGLFDLGNGQWDIPYLRVLLEDVLPKNDTVDDYEIRHDFESIGQKTMLLNARKIVKRKNDPAVILLAIEDITGRRQMEDLLKESEERYRRIFETASDGILLLEKSRGNIAHVNPAAEKMMGYTEAECAGKNLRDIGVSLDVSDFPAIMQTLEKSGIINYGDVPVKTRSGLDICTDIYIVDRAHLAQCNIRETTERKKLEDQLRQAQKMEAVGLLAGGIAHDFNNILSAIVGYGSLLQTKMHPDDPLREYADQILVSADRAAEVTHSLLAFSKKQQLNPKPISINALIKRLEKLLSRLIGEDIELKTAFASQDIVSMADAGQIEQVLLNLAMNARDAMPHGGHLTLATERVELDDTFLREHGYGAPGLYAVISVSDTGIGIPKEIMDKIFEPFFTTKDPDKGTGLGLAMAYGIIRQHKGYINVYSEPGMGTTFRIYLPVIACAEESIAKSPVEPLPLMGSETILIAEDDAILRKLLSTILLANGYKVILAEDGEAAIRTFSDNRDEIQLVMLDMIMPRISGKEVFDQIRKMRPAIKTLFSSGYTADRIDKESLLQEGVDFIMKPVSPKDLLRVIRRMLDN